MANNTSALIKVAARAIRLPRQAGGAGSLRPAAVNRNIRPARPAHPARISNGNAGPVTPAGTPTAMPRQQYLPGFDPRHSMRGPYPSKQTPNAGAHYEAQMRANGFVRDMQGNWVHRNSYDPTTPAGTPTARSVATADMPTRPLASANIPASTPIRPIALDVPPAALRPGSVPKPSLMSRMGRLLDSNIGLGAYYGAVAAGGAGTLGYLGYKGITSNGQNQPAPSPQPVTIPQPAQQDYPSVTGPTPRSLTMPWMN